MEGGREAGREGGVIQLSLVHLFSEFTHLNPWPARIAKLCMYVCMYVEVAVARLLALHA